MPRKNGEERDYPTAAQALEDDDAREERKARGEQVKAEAHAEVGAGEARSPKELHPTLPADLRPGLPPVRPTGRLKAGDPEAPPVIEQNQALLDQVQDPYNERRPKEVPTVNVTDSYGNVVSMPV